MNHREIKVRERLSRRITFVDGPFDLQKEIHEIGTGVLFIRALWSGQCAASYSVFTNAVMHTPPHAFAAHVVDNDHCDPIQCQELLGDISHGFGESFWIKDSAVVYSDRGYHNGPLSRVLKKRILEFSGVDVPVPGDGLEGVFAAGVMRNCEGLDPNLIEIYDLECREISDLGLAVVTLYHPNHAASIVTLRNLLKALLTTNNDEIRLIVLHSDAVSRKDMRQIYGDFPRSATTYWVKNGTIIERDDGYPEKGNATLPTMRIKALTRRERG